MNLHSQTQGETIKRAVEATESAIVNLGYGELADRQSGDCGLVSDIAAIAMPYSAQQSGTIVEVNIYQLQDVHHVAAGLPVRPWQAAISKFAFQHSFDTAKIGSALYLVDLSFAQFVTGDGIIEEKVLFETPEDEAYAMSRRRAPLFYGDSPLAKSLVEQGFTELNDKVLQEYLSLTTLDGGETYTQNATLKHLVATPTLEEDRDTTFRSGVISAINRTTERPLGQKTSQLGQS